MPDFVALYPIALMLGELLDELHIRYIAVGSMAGGLHGRLRNTHDVDLLADIQTQHVKRLAQRLTPHFENVQEANIHAAIDDARHFRDPGRNARSQPSINLVHRTEPMHADIFLPVGEPFERSQFERRIHLSADASGRAVWVASVEDTILAKTRWLGIAEGSSEHQLGRCPGAACYPPWDVEHALFALLGRTA